MQDVATMTKNFVESHDLSEIRKSLVQVMTRDMIANPQLYDPDGDHYENMLELHAFLERIE